MRKIIFLLSIGITFVLGLAACGDSDSSKTSSGPGTGGGAHAAGGAGGSGGSGGGAGAPSVCPKGPLDEAVKALEGMPCSTLGEECASNNGCGGCSVTCKDGVWTATDGPICYDVGPGC